MANILSISSQVARGHVGNSVTQFVLQRLGHEAWALPSVLLSNHPGHKKFGGARLKSSILRPVLEALEMSRQLKHVDAVMTGYLPSREHVFIALDALKMVKTANPKAVYLCDPALGDDPRPGSPQGLYIDVKAAESLRTELLPLADIVTPNRFELEWLSMRPVMDEASAAKAMQVLGHDALLATSIPTMGDRLSNVLLCGEGEFVARVDALDAVPHGTGDMLAALFMAHLQNGASAPDALGLAVGGVGAALQESVEQEDIRLIPTQDAWSSAAPATVTPLAELV